MSGRRFVAGRVMLDNVVGVNLPAGSAVKRLKELGHEVAPLLWCSATPLVHVREDAFERIAAQLPNALRAAMPADGVLPDLHGAMVREHVADGGAEFRGAFEVASQQRDIAPYVLPPRSPQRGACVERAHRIARGVLRPASARVEPAGREPGVGHLPAPRPAARRQRPNLPHLTAYYQSLAEAARVSNVLNPHTMQDSGPCP